MCRSDDYPPYWRTHDHPTWSHDVAYGPCTLSPERGVHPAHVSVRYGQAGLDSTPAVPSHGPRCVVCVPLTLSELDARTNPKGGVSK